MLKNCLFLPISKKEFFTFFTPTSLCLAGAWLSLAYTQLSQVCPKETQSAFRVHYLKCLVPFGHFGKYFFTRDQFPQIHYIQPTKMDTISSKVSLSINKKA